jgi:hypothetical protein
MRLWNRPSAVRLALRLARVSILRPGIARQRPLLLCAGKIAEATENTREGAQRHSLHSLRKNSPQARKREGA